MRCDLSDDAEASDSIPPHRSSWRRLARGAISLWLVFHISAVILAPASVSPSSGLVRSAWDLCRPYLQVLYLNHGYHFFAPEPSASTLVAFVAEREDGTVLHGRIPHRDIGPRLLYHRHFMLTEHLGAAEPGLRGPWCRSYANHIGREYQAAKVSLTMIRHNLPTMEMVRNGVPLDDPRSYEEQPLGVFRCDAF